jgi:plasmid stabilization system protein ParE
MPRGSKDKYTDKQKRKAEHIEESYEQKGVPEGKAEARAWATVNKQSGGGERSGGSGKKKPAEAKQSDRKESARRAVKSREGHPRTSKASHEAQTVDAQAGVGRGVAQGWVMVGVSKHAFASRLAPTQDLRCASVSAPGTNPVGASLLAKAVGQPPAMFSAASTDRSPPPATGSNHG